MQNPAKGLLASVILLNSLHIVAAANFTFAYSEATQCNGFNVSWSGGTAPFSLTIIPVRGTPTTINIPSSSYANGGGLFDTQLTNMKESDTFLAVMSDAGGFATGGVTDVITIGAGSSGCNTTLESPDFVFDDDNLPLEQCKEFQFSNYVNAVQPVTIMGVIPGGTSFILKPPAGNTTFDWMANLATGTSVLFFMQDADGKQGGSTSIMPIDASDDASCLTGSYPSSLASIPSYTTFSFSFEAPTQTVSATVAPSSVRTTAAPVPNSTSAGTIAGAVVGTACILVVLFFLYRKRNGKRTLGGTRVFDLSEGDKPMLDPAPESGEITSSPAVDPYPLYRLTAGSETQLEGQAFLPVSALGVARSGSPYNTSSSGDSAYNTHDAPPAHSHTRQASQTDTGSFGGSSGIRDSAMSEDSRGVLMGTPRKALAAAAGFPPDRREPPTRFILHTDAVDVVELPPQYSAQRPPLTADLIASDNEADPSVPNHGDQAIRTTTD